MKTCVILIVIGFLGFCILPTRTMAQDSDSHMSDTTFEGETFSNSIGMEFVLIPAGEFWMGNNCKDDPFTEKEECEDVPEDEHPYHEVIISRPFYMSRTEVTQEQWYEVMGNNPAYFKTEKVGMTSRNHPVDSVSWYDAQEFVRKLNEQEGTDAYRLPTEAEWEYACRAGTDTRYFFGDDVSPLGDYAWHDDNANGTTHQIGQKQPNAFGLYDMYGNVWEWVADSWHDNYEGAPTDGTVWRNSDNEEANVLRGGAWDTEPSLLRCSNRDKGTTGGQGRFDGFRVVADVTDAHN